MVRSDHGCYLDNVHIISCYHSNGGGGDLKNVAGGHSNSEKPII